MRRMPRHLEIGSQSLKFQQLEAARRRHDKICFALSGGIIGLAFSLPNLFEEITAELTLTNALIFLGAVLALWHGGHERLHKKEIKAFGKVNFQTPYIGEFSKIIMWVPGGLLILFKGIPMIFDLISCILKLTS